MEGTPEYALSVRQPWAWAIIHAGKDVENRSWQAVNHGLKRRGRIVIHASKGMTQHEYESAKCFIDEANRDCLVPTPDALQRGCIIGTVEVHDVVAKDNGSPWWMGPRGLLLRDPEPLAPLGMTPGALGYFKWRETDQPIEEPKPWMKAWPGDLVRNNKPPAEMPLFTPSTDTGAG